ELDQEISGLVRDGRELSTDEPVDRGLIKRWRDAAKVNEKAVEIEQDAFTRTGDQLADLKASKNLVTDVPWDIRLRRALRVVANNKAERDISLQAFDGTVYDIECSRGDEFYGKSILNAWRANPSDRSTCAVCDSRTWCSSFASQYGAGRSIFPECPRVKL